ncbi:hypothetical protein BUALT_BualtUnG0046800 [Buddleja alternifolia]|uniref:Aldose 1-epimerase n=1 Tax=Buddleja alternifolia TaxID=168488 RepID=A0AAV6W6U8_9LAMI|nr:hypothetical protein BUALT_BualtUnG0046800 [Buddleja alternifolia]
MAEPKLFELNNGNVQVKVSNFGCTITSLCVPDKDGKLGDVVLGFDTLEPYLKGVAPYFGCIVGRVANRIKDGKFTLNGTDYALPINKPPNSLHGGYKGFDKVIWEVAEHKQEGDNPSITFKYRSCDGEEGYPGDVSFTATYTLASKTTMRLDMEGIPENKATPINLAQHTYWNLGGHNSGNILDHTIQIWANHITPVDQNTVPTGEIMPVRGTPFDFTTENKIGSRINEVGLGYDHNYVLDCGKEKLGLKHAAKLKDPNSSRTLNLWTDAPGMQFYTANYVSGIVGKGGAAYEKHAAACLETQGFPNAINQPNFPCVVVQPGDKYKHTMLFEFSTE